MRIFIIAVAMLVATFPLHADIRTWTDSTGKYKTKAEFVSLRNGKVTLKKEDGVVRVLPLSRLSDADQKIAEDLAKESTKKSGRRNSGFINSVRAAPMRTQSISKMKTTHAWPDQFRIGNKSVSHRCRRSGWQTGPELAGGDFAVHRREQSLQAIPPKRAVG